MSGDLMSAEPLIFRGHAASAVPARFGKIAGEKILLYVRGGAVLADLGLAGRVGAEQHGLFVQVRPTGEGEPPDPLLEQALTPPIASPSSFEQLHARMARTELTSPAEVFAHLDAAPGESAPATKGL